MDEKNVKILECLTRNSKMSTKAISRETAIPLTTVHNRIKKMEREGIIEGYTILLNNKKIGKLVSAYVLVCTDYTKLREIGMSHQKLAKKISSNEYVEEAVTITGAHDLIIKVNVKDMDELNKFLTEYLRSFEGIRKIETLVSLSQAQ